MGKLFLSASFQDVAHILANFEQNLAGRTVTFIPTASLVEEVVFYVDAGKQALEALGLTVDVLEISTASADDIHAKLKGNDIIYVTGGNTFYLLQELKRTGTDKMISEEVRAGKLYIGESAGAIITAPNIEYVQGMDNAAEAPDLLNYDALGLVDFYTVPHYNDVPFAEVAHQIVAQYAPLVPVAVISNHQAILVEGDDVRIEANE